VQTLLEVIDQLPVSVIRGPLPVILRFVDGPDYQVNCASWLMALEKRFAGLNPSYLKKVMEIRERLSHETSNAKRSY